MPEIIADSIPKWRIYATIGAYVAYFAIHVSRSLIAFPFLRSIVNCDSEVNNGDWTGSPFCGDERITTLQATLMKGWATGIDTALQVIFLPILGRTADIYGRRPVILLGYLSTVIACGLFLFAALFHTFSPYIIAYAVQGIASAVSPINTALIAVR